MASAFYAFEIFYASLPSLDMADASQKVECVNDWFIKSKYLIKQYHCTITMELFFT